MVIVKHYTWLIALSFFAIWSSLQISTWADSIQELIIFLPYISIALGIFIALWLNRIQPALILLSLGCFNTVLFYFSSSDLGLELITSTLFPILILLLPFNILLWMLLPEKGLFNKRLNLLILFVFIVQGGGIYCLVTHDSIQTLDVLMASIPFLQEYAQNYGLTLLLLPAGVMFLLTILFIILKMNKSNFKILYHSVFVVLILMLYGVNQGFEPNGLAWIITFSAIVLTLSMIFEAHHMAYTDELTGILGRRALMEHFLGLGKKYVVAMVDIDHFKKFNDTYGHDVGDEVLRRVARVLNQVKGGRAFRYGGEEFTIVFSNQTVAEVSAELEYLRRSVESGVLEFKSGLNSIKTNVTVSIGVAQSCDDLKEAQDVLKLADKGLYEAKKAGRNKVIVSEYRADKIQVNH